MRRIGSLTLLIVVLSCGAALAGQLQPQDANRLTYLDEPCDPYYVGRHFPKLTTPQWLGEPGVEAVVVLAIDDMRDSQHYENYLRPILDRLKEIDGRAGLSIMTNRASADDAQLQGWLNEGVSIEVHTYDHPCPCLKDGDFAKAKETYDRCVDLMFSIPGNKPVAYRMPCCDSLNTPSPRFWSEIMHRQTPGSHHLSIDSSVFQIFTPMDPELPGDLLIDENGERRFRKYLPFPSFVNTIEDYPYPYVIGRMSWEFPCMVPSDWEAQNIQGPNNPTSVDDMKVALDLTVVKQGVFNLVFHPHGWMRNDQVVELIDHAVEKHGSKVKFLSFREAHDRLNAYLLAGHPLRSNSGWDNGVRLLDVNQDGYIDVTIGNEETQLTRVWNPRQQEWRETTFPFAIVGDSASGSPAESRVRFGTDADGRTMAMGVNEDGKVSAYVFQDENWQSVADASGVFESIEMMGDDPNRPLNGIYLRDVDSQPGTEILIGRSARGRREVWFVDGQGEWREKAYGLPEPAQLDWDSYGEHGVRFVDLDDDGDDDLVISNEREFAVYLFESDNTGWSKQVRRGQRGDSHAIPMISRDGKNNGAWFHSHHLWIQNEGTHRLPDLVDRVSFAELRQPPQDEAKPIEGEPQPEPDSINLRDNLPKPLSPEDALRSLKTRPELRVELVASEPLIQDPVAFDWGADGSLWVAEMGDYPRGSDAALDERIQLRTDERNAHGTGRIRVLRDTDGDGAYDQSTVFLDGLSFPNAVKFWRDGVFVMAAPDVVFASDIDGDDRADLVELKLTGFVPGNQQHRANGLRWGLDGWLHIANGDSGGIIRLPGSDSGLVLRGFDLVYHPLEERIALTTGQTQFGRNRDDWGHWFGGNNSNPMWQYVLDERDIGHNPYVATPNLRHDIPRKAGNAPVYPISVTLERFNDLHTANRITSACSPIIFRADTLGASFYGNAFVCEPVHNLVHREVVRAQGPLLISERAADEQRSEFLSSTDSWFRPVMVRTGLDGALWIADMYRLVIEHPEWIPLQWQQRLDLRAGHDRGRIYRVVLRDQSPAAIPKLSDDSDDQLLNRLLSANGSVRDLAQQMLIWRGFKDGDKLRQLFATASLAQSRLQILYTLSCLELLDEITLESALRDAHLQVRRGAIRLAGQAARDHRLENPSLILPEMIAAADGIPELELEMATSLSAFNDELAGLWLANQLLRPNLDIYLRAAVFSSVTPFNAEIILRELVAEDNAEPGGVDESVWQDVVQSAVGFQKADVVVDYLMDECKKKTIDTTPTAEDLSRLTAILTGLQPVTRDDRLRAIRESLAQSSSAWALTESLPISKRIAAMELLRATGETPTSPVTSFAKLVSIQEPLEIQIAAVELISSAFPEKFDLLMQRWADATPALRDEILAAALRNDDGPRHVVNAIESGLLSIDSLSAARLQQLLRQVDAKDRERLQSLSIAVTTDRAALIDKFAQANQLNGDSGRGREAFKKTCSNCHQLGDLGQAIGPDLRSLTDRSKQALITAILDPNRAVEDKYLDYAVITADGHQYSGMLLAESSASLRLATAEGKQIDVLRSEVESVGTSGRSLMPEGLEKELDVQAMADVIAYVQSYQLPAKQFVGNRPRPIQPNENQELHLPADAARIYGPSLVFEPQYKNLGWWSSSDDYAIWDLEITTADTYEVILDYAAHSSAAGDHFVLSIGDQTLKGQVASTGTWEDYQVRKIGRIRLEPGSYELVIRSDGPVRQAMIDLREVQLMPFLLDE